MTGWFPRKRTTEHRGRPRRIDTHQPVKRRKGQRQTEQNHRRRRELAQLQNGVGIAGAVDFDRLAIVERASDGPERKEDHRATERTAAVKVPGLRLHRELDQRRDTLALLMPSMFIHGGMSWRTPQSG